MCTVNVWYCSCREGRFSKRREQSGCTLRGTCMKTSVGMVSSRGVVVEGRKMAGLKMS